MCETLNRDDRKSGKTIPVSEAVGTVLAHDITEIRPGKFKGCAFRKGHVVRQEDVCHLQRLGKENLFVMKIEGDEMHEDDAAYALASALMGEGVEIKGEPREGKIDIIASREGLLKIERDALHAMNMLGEVMCATLHTNTLVKKGQTVAGTRAIPLVVKRDVVEKAVSILKGPGGRTSEGSGGQGFKDSGIGCSDSRTLEPQNPVVQVLPLKRPRAGIVITGNEVYEGLIRDAFAPVIRQKIEEFGGEIVGLHYAPDNREYIRTRLSELLSAGADLLITTGGMSVDPDDVTRFAISDLGATVIVYGSAVLPGAMFLVAYITPPSSPPCQGGERGGIPVLGIPACGMYAKTTVFDLVLPRVLAGEKIGRKELAELGHGGLCLKCETCRYPVCPLGKG